MDWIQQLLNSTDQAGDNTPDFPPEYSKSEPSEGSKVKNGGDGEQTMLSEVIVPPSIVTQEGQQEPPKNPCYVCSSVKWWRKKDRSGPWVCPVCHPPPFDQNDIEHFSTP